MKKLLLAISSLFTISLLSSCNSKSSVYKVTWLNDDNTIINQTSVIVGERPEHRDPTSKIDPSFGHHNSFEVWKNPEDGSELDENYKMPDHDVTFKAYFNEEANEHTIFWINDDGFLIDKSIEKYNDHPTHETPISSKLSKLGYHFEFVNWIDQESSLYSDDFLMPDDDVIFTAIYTEKINSYEVTWVDQFGSLIDTTYVEYNHAPTHDDAKKAPDEKKSEEYFFKGWFIDNKEINLEDIDVTENITIEARYDVFNLGGCEYLIDEENESYHVTGVQKDYPKTKFIILNNFKNKPVTKIEDEAFWQLEILNLEFVIGDNVETIGKMSFHSNDLKSLVFGNNSHLKTIESYAFWSISSLKEFKVPSTLEKIEDMAFGYATINLFDFSELNKVPTIEGDPFFGMENKFSINVKQSLLEDFKTAWPDVADHFVGIND